MWNHSNRGCIFSNHLIEKGTSVMDSGFGFVMGILVTLAVIAIISNVNGGSIL